MKLVAQGFQLLSDVMPFGAVSIPFQLAGVDGLFEAEAVHRPRYDAEGNPTDEQVLEVLVRRIA